MGKIALCFSLLRFISCTNTKIGRYWDTQTLLHIHQLLSIFETDTSLSLYFSSPVIRLCKSEISSQLSKKKSSQARLVIIHFCTAISIYSSPYFRCSLITRSIPPNHRGLHRLLDENFHHPMATVENGGHGKQAKTLLSYLTFAKITHTYIEHDSGRSPYIRIHAALDGSWPPIFMHFSALTRAFSLIHPQGCKKNWRIFPFSYFSVKNFLKVKNRSTFTTWSTSVIRYPTGFTCNFTLRAQASLQDNPAALIYTATGILWNKKLHFLLTSGTQK